MTTQSRDTDLTPKELDQYGYVRAQDLAFDAVVKLWRKRQKEGVTQNDLAQAIGWDPAVVSRKFHGPSNWTLRTLGALVEALRGDLRILVTAVEQPSLSQTKDSDAYSGYDLQPTRSTVVFTAPSISKALMTSSSEPNFTTTRSIPIGTSD